MVGLKSHGSIRPSNTRTEEQTLIFYTCGRVSDIPRLSSKCTSLSGSCFMAFSQASNVKCVGTIAANPFSASKPQCRVCPESFRACSHATLQASSAAGIQRTAPSIPPGRVDAGSTGYRHDPAISGAVKVNSDSLSCGHAGNLSTFLLGEFGQLLLNICPLFLTFD